MASREYGMEVSWTTAEAVVFAEYNRIMGKQARDAFAFNCAVLRGEANEADRMPPMDPHAVKAMAQEIVAGRTQ